METLETQLSDKDVSMLRLNCLGAELNSYVLGNDK